MTTAAFPMQSTPTSGKSAKPVAGVMLLLTTIFLIILSGCFLIGVMIVSNPFQNWGVLSTPAPTPTVANTILITVLYAFAVITFACAMWVLSIGVRWLKKILLES